ncbi:MAG: alpha/beta hydrolase [Pseudomonadota bacterium]
MIPIEDWRARAQYFSVGSYQIAYWASENADDKPTLLLIHGYPTSSWDWSALWPSLEEMFHLVALDMLGFGLSDKPRNIRYSIMQQADLQEALLQHLGIGAAHVFTHDYGNTVGQELLARDHEKSLSFAIKSICFLNGGLFPEQHRARPIQKLGLTPFGWLLGLMLSPSRFRKTFDEIFGPETKASDEEINGHWAMIAHNGGRSVLHKLLNYIPERIEHRERWVGALKNTVTPMRLINGGFDPVSGEHLYHYYKEQAPNADAVLLPKIGHYPHTEAPSDVLAAFTDFHATIRSGVH